MHNCLASAVRDASGPDEATQFPVDGEVANAPDYVQNSGGGWPCRIKRRDEGSPAYVLLLNGSGVVSGSC